ncbi:MAG: RNA-binding domain-containing protein [Saprospiraceae bacterium]
MNSEELLSLIAGGENSYVQFKENATNAVSIAQEIVAFANSKGGTLIFGVNDKTGAVTGLAFSDIQRINNLLTTAANDHVKSAMVIQTKSVDVQGKKVLVMHIPEGSDKPYMDKDGLIFLKNGSDKRKVTSREELSRLLQSSGNLYAEEKVLHQSSVSDIDWDKFKAFYIQKYKEEPSFVQLERYLFNFRLGQNGHLNTAGALLFGKNLQRLLPQFFISAIWFAGNDITGTVYRSSENIIGTIQEQYFRGYDFIRTKINYVQGDKNFNSLGEPEVPLIVFSELLANALIHRDYFVNDSIKIFIFQNRIEIKSPGRLPNNLTVQEMQMGLRKSRNFILASIVPDLIDYRGIGSGILRALQAWPHIEFQHFPEAEQFNVIIHRPPQTV